MLRLSAVLLVVEMLAWLVLRTGANWQMTCYYFNFKIHLSESFHVQHRKK
jgi:hypothetical protein